MTTDRWRAITGIFHAALARDEAARPAFVADACKADASLQSEVEALLAAHDAAGSFGDVPGFAPAITPLAPGTPLGPYRIESLIGAGGMGEVYRATDTRLRRTVAIKVLSPPLRASAELQARFEREARTISQLGHPHICALYDVGHDQDVDFLVMEHLEGETLAARLSRGAMPLDHALRIGIEIARALDHAHRHGVVHRDLKPGNVMLTKAGAKLLDFGVAKVRQPAIPATSSSPARQDRGTAAGALLGTLPYMAPEQLEGHEADARSDIWALGCVLYEMVTHRRTFDGSSHAILIAAILEHEPPPIVTLQPLAPPFLDRVIRTCLAKDPDERWQSVADVTRELEWIARGDRTVTEVRRHRTRHSWTIAAALTFLATAAALWWVAWRRPAQQVPTGTPAHFTISLAAARLTLTGGGIAVSPDGHTVVFAARAGDDDVRLYTRRLDEWEPRALKGTEGAITPFFSADGTWIAFVANGILKKMHLPDGTPQTLCRVGYQGRTRGHWDSSGSIVIAQWPGGIGRVASEGSSLQPITPSAGAANFLWPQMLPDGHTLLFTIWNRSGSRLASFRTDTGVIRTVIESGSCGRYLPTGHLVYESEGHLLAVPFDAARLEPVGTSRVVIDDLTVGRTSAMSNLNYDVSSTGTLAFVPASASLSTLVWKDRAGHTAALPFSSRVYTFPALSPDGRRLTVSITDWPEWNVFTGSVDREPLTRLADGSNSVFSRDGKWIAFSNIQDGWFNLSRVRADGTGEPERLLTAAAHQKATSWSPSGDKLLFNEVGEGDVPNRNIAEVDVLHRRQRAFLSTPKSEIEAAFSTDGRWVAYQSDASGKWEIYVRSYAGEGPGRQVSIGGGMAPVWNPRGGELFYQTRTALMSVRVENGAALSAPTTLFAYRKSEDARREFDVAPDGDHFLFLEPATARAEINVITNWFEELKERVPVPRP